MDIIPYENAYRQAVIDLILHIQGHALFCSPLP